MTEPGLSPQRTRLAWRRTALAGAVVALLAARLATRAELTPVRVMLAALALGGWSTLVGLTLRRLRAGAAPPPRWTLPLVALLVAGYAALGSALVTLL